MSKYSRELMEAEISRLDAEIRRNAVLAVSYSRQEKFAEANACLWRGTLAVELKAILCDKLSQRADGEREQKP